MKCNVCERYCNTYKQICFLDKIQLFGICADIAMYFGIFPTFDWIPHETSVL